MSPASGFLVDLWPYRLAAGRPDLLLIHRTPRRGAGDAFWQGVSGGIERGETAVQAAMRELAEETGVERWRALYTLDAGFQLYDAAVDIAFTVIPFAAEVDANAEVRLSDEHDAWRWAPVDEALELLSFEPQRNAVRRLLADIIERPEEAFRFRVEGGDV